MKTTINTTKLKTAFNACKKVINPKSAVIASTNYHLKTWGGLLQITSTDLENYLTISIPCSGEIDCLIPELDKILSKLDGSDTEISAGDKIILTSGGDVFTFAKYEGDFPKSESDAPNYIATLKELSTELKQHSEFRSKDELRLKLTGTYFEFIKSGLILTTTDAHRLKTNTIECNSGSEVNFIMPAKACKLIEQLKLNDCDIYKQGKNIILRSIYCGLSLEYVCREIDDTYPYYRQVIPQDNPITVTLQNKDLLKAIDKSKVINEIKNSFKFNECLELTAENIDFEQTYSTKIAAQKTGEDITIGFNPLLLETVLKSLPEQVNIELSTKDRAAIFNRSEIGLTLLMPIMLEVEPI